MKYKHRDELVEGLRSLADFIEERGLELPIDSPSVELSEWLYDDYYGRKKRTARDKIRHVAKIIGRAEKSFDYRFDLTRKFGPFVSLEFSVSRETVCERRVIGKKTVPAQVHSSPERVEDVVEWICVDPILAPVKEA